MTGHGREKMHDEAAKWLYDTGSGEMPMGSQILIV